MNEELDYAEMLEIPVSTVNVTKKKSIFRRKQKQSEQPQDDLKEQVVESVNERVGAYVISEDVSDPPKPEKKPKSTAKKDNGSKVLITEAVLVCAIALAIFLTNVFMPNTIINTFLNSIGTTAAEEPVYSEFTLSPVVSGLSDAEVYITDSGVITFTAEGSVYPVCKGTVSKVYKENENYTVEIAHTSTFVSVVTGLSDVYSAVGTKVVSNIPVGYSDGSKEVRVSMYDNGSLLNCFTLTDEVPVWKS